MAKKDELQLTIQDINFENHELIIMGRSPLITHPFSEKAKQAILDKETGAVKTKSREIRKPFEEFVDSVYWIDKAPKEKTEKGFLEAIRNGARFGIPATAIREATVSAAKRMGLAVGTELNAVFSIVGEGKDQLIEIITDELPEMREDRVTVGMGSAELRFRAQFNNWKIKLPITFIAGGKYTFEQLVNFINLAGYACGIGDWRHECNGSYGSFKVATDSDLSA